MSRVSDDSATRKWFRVVNNEINTHERVGQRKSSKHKNLELGAPVKMCKNRANRKRAVREDREKKDLTNEGLAKRKARSPAIK